MGDDPWLVDLTELTALCLKVAKHAHFNLLFCFLSGKADKHLCEAVLYELHQAVLKTTDDPIRQAWHTVAVM